jgi:UDP-glucose 4-epimerase
MSKILVTGGCGFIGSHLVERLLEKGYQVVIVDDFSTGHNRNKKAKTYKTSITNFPKLNNIFKKESPSKVIHLAAKARIQPSITNPLGYNETNVNGTLNVLEAARAQGIKKVLFASSSSVMFGTSDLPYKESNHPIPTTPYSLTKYIDELYAALYSNLYGLETIGFRFFNVYGRRMTKGSYKTVITIFAEQVKNKLPLTIVGDGKQKRDFTHVSDIVAGIIMALEKDGLSGEIINLGRSHSVTIEKVANLVAGEEYPKDYGHKRIGETSETLSDTSKAHDLLGWSSKIDIEDGIKEVLIEEGIVRS